MNEKKNEAQVRDVASQGFLLWRKKKVHDSACRQGLNAKHTKNYYNQDLNHLNEEILLNKGERASHSLTPDNRRSGGLWS